MKNGSADRIVRSIRRQFTVHENGMLHAHRSVFDGEQERCAADTYSDPCRDLRTPYAHDIDRIIHCHSYARYMDKTQVFFQIKNDHLTRRSLHVQMVSRIARTIGRCLCLNEDLIEAIAVGHDIGHTPFGHAGEADLGKILEEKGVGTFIHNAQSVRVLHFLENRGKGLNLTLPVLDGILGHNGEMESQEYHPQPQNLRWSILFENLEKCLTIPKADRNVAPSTLEGCVVRISDILSYVGKDLEDAVTLRIVSRHDIPKGVAEVLGTTNREIVQTLCNDLILSSYGKDYITFTPCVYEALCTLKKFNYDKIYGCKLLTRQKEKFSKMVRELFEVYLKDIKSAKSSSDIFVDFISHFDTDYWRKTRSERIVADYIASMTDQYFLKQYETRFLPHLIDYNEVKTSDLLSNELLM